LGGSREVMTAEPPLTDKQKIGEYARQVLDRVHAVSLMGRRLRGAAAQLQAAVRQQVAVLNREQIWAQLERMPITELRRSLGKGLRLGVLEQAGYETVSRIHSASQQELTAIPGVGSQTAFAVRNAAAAVVEQIGADTRFRFDPDRRDS